MDYNLRRENLKRRNYDYKEGMEVLELTTHPTNFGQLTCGRFMTGQVHCNGSITIRRNSNAVDRINIWNVPPFKLAAENQEQVYLNLHGECRSPLGNQHRIDHGSSLSLVQLPWRGKVQDSFEYCD